MITAETLEKIDDAVKSFGEFNGNEIEWLAVGFNQEKNFALIISKYIIENKKCGKYLLDEDSVNTWLEKDFYNEAFTPSEKACIINTYLHFMGQTNEYEPINERLRGFYRVFLFDDAEAKRFFKDDGGRIGLNLGDKAPAAWALRSPQTGDFYPIVNEAGTVLYKAVHYSQNIGIRPAMWVDINSLLDADFRKKVLRERSDAKKERAQNEIYGLQNLIAKAKTEKSKLGLFGSKKKKQELDEQIKSHEARIKDLMKYL